LDYLFEFVSPNQINLNFSETGFLSVYPKISVFAVQNLGLSSFSGFFYHRCPQMNTDVGESVAMSVSELAFPVGEACAKRIGVRRCTWGFFVGWRCLGFLL